MNKSLCELSRVYPHVQFLRARSDRIGLDDYPDIGLPTLIVWKNGQQLNSFISMQKLVQTPFTPRIIQEFLIKLRLHSIPFFLLPFCYCCCCFGDIKFQCAKIVFFSFFL